LLKTSEHSESGKSWIFFDLCFVISGAIRVKPRRSKWSLISENSHAALLGDDILEDLRVLEEGSGVVASAQDTQ
jgi:hypothetical protein